MTNETQAPAQPQAGEFWVNKHSGVRVEVREVVKNAARTTIGFLISDVHEGMAIDLGFRYPVEFTERYERMGTMDEAHDAALAEMDAEMCDECQGQGVEPELIDAPDYKGPAACQACDGHGWWRAEHWLG